MRVCYPKRSSICDMLNKIIFIMKSFRLIFKTIQLFNDSNNSNETSQRLREHTFNLKGGGGYGVFFWGGGHFLSANLIAKNILKALYALKTCFCRKKNIATTQKKMSASPQNKKNILTPLKTIAPPPP